MPDTRTAGRPGAHQGSPPVTLPVVSSGELAPPEGAQPLDPYGPERFARSNQIAEQAFALKRAHTLNLLLALLAVGLFAGLIYHSTRTRIRPYVVEVDRRGHAVAAGVAEEMPAPDERMILHAISVWIVRTRTVTTDKALQQREIVRAYAFTRGPAVKRLNDWYRTHPPFARARRQTVSVELESILALDDTARRYRVQWTETIRSPSGGVIDTQPWQAVLTVTVDPPERTEEVLTNPLGIAVTTFDWQRLVNH